MYSNKTIISCNFSLLFLAKLFILYHSSNNKTVIHLITKITRQRNMWFSFSKRSFSGSMKLILPSFTQAPEKYSPKQKTPNIKNFIYISFEEIKS